MIISNLYNTPTIKKRKQYASETYHLTTRALKLLRIKIKLTYKNAKRYFVSAAEHT